MKRAVALVAAAVSLLPAACAQAQDPGTAEWTQVPRDRMVAECGMDPDILDSQAAKFIHTPFVVIRHGKLCWEGGYPGGSTEKYQVYSVTKTFGAMLFGMIASHTALSDMDPVTKWIDPADMDSTSAACPTSSPGTCTVNPKARLLHVLGMVSTNPDLAPGKKGPWGYDTTGDREINKLLPVMDKAIAADPAAFPGIKKTTDLAQKWLFDPLGMKSSSWAGGGIASDLMSSVRDMARLGQLVLQRGRWQGRQLIDEEYLYRMTHPSFEDVNTGYGYLTYVNAAANYTWSTSTADLNCAPFGEWPSYPHRPLYEWPDPNGGVPGNRKQVYDIAHTFASGTGGQKFIIYRGVDMVIAIRNGAGSVADGGTVVDQFSGHKTVWNAVRAAMLPFDEKYKNDEAGFCAAYRASDYAPDLREPWFEESVPQPSGPAATQPAPAPQPACVARRRVVVKIGRPRGMRVRKVAVRLGARRIRVRRGRAIVDLTGRKPGVAIVRIRITGTRHGKMVTLRSSRRLRTCGLTVDRG